MKKERVTIVLEAGNCHEGILANALRMMDAAKESGADIVKFQAGYAEGFARGPEDVGRYRKYELGMEGYTALINYGNKIGIPVCFSVWSEGFSIFSGLKYFKIAARQCSNKYLDRFGRGNVFVSIPHKMKPKEIKKLNIGACIPLHCVTEYPAKDAKLERIKWLAEFLGKPVGYSDHTIGIENCVKAAKEYGACVIEKHFTLDHNFGPLRDHEHAATPSEFAEMVARIRR